MPKPSLEIMIFRIIFRISLFWRKGTRGKLKKLPPITPPLFALPINIVRKKGLIRKNILAEAPSPSWPHDLDYNWGRNPHA